jgi:dTDP-4-dehydrorhamnose reductase
MSILIFGKNGQIGKELVSRLRKNMEVYAFNSKEVNFLDTRNLEKKIDIIKPKIIINAAAYTKVDEAEKNKKEAFIINSEAVGLIASKARENGSKLIHFSTDYVFNGNKKTSYKESDLTNPINVYGQSKLRGESLIINSKCNYFILRTSWVISKYGNNFLSKIIDQILNREELKIVNDQYGAPSSANFIAKVVKKIIDSDKNIKDVIYHCINSGIVSWYEITQYVYKYLRRNSLESKNEKIKNLMKKNLVIQPIHSKDLALLAKRPKFSKLNCSKLQKVLHYKFPIWQLEVKKIIKEII